MFEVSKRHRSTSLERVDDVIAEPTAPAKLDSGPMKALHRKLLGHYVRELDRQTENRAKMQLDDDFYDGIQWSEIDAAVLEERGQMPLVYNVISASIDWVTGTERRARTDFKVLPRRKAEAKPAERKSELMKYLSDVNKSQFTVSRAFEDAAKVGVGWIEDGVQGDDEGEPIYCRYESWRNILFDSHNRELDHDTGRYVFRSKWLDVDVAAALFTKRQSVIEQAKEQADEWRGLSAYGDEAMDNPEFALDTIARAGVDDIGAAGRERVRCIEGWYRVPAETRRLKGGRFAGEIFDPSSRGHIEDVEAGEAQIKSGVTMRVHVALMTSTGLLYHGPSPYRHNRYPLTPVWAYRRGRDGLPYGMIRRLRDIQQDINKRASKAQHILATNKVIVEKDAVEDIDEFIEEAARPDGVMVVKPGKIGAVKTDVDRELPQWHLELMSRSIAMIQQASGVTDENLGRRTNAASGVAIQRRQDQGALATALLFDNLRHAMQVRGEKQLSLIEQFVTEAKAFRITNMRGAPQFVEVNDGLPDNDIARSKADYVISDADWRASMRQAAVDQLVEVLAKFAPVAPQLVMVMLDLVVESMDLPNREELVRRIRSITNMSDPDADEQEQPSPEAQAKAAAEDAAQKMQAAQAAAQITKMEAEAARTQAQADKLRADIVNARVAAQSGALQAAATAVSMPATVHIADHILAETGFQGASQTRAAAPAPAIPPQPQDPAAAPGITPAGGMPT
ncbi:hypothetical protein [Microcystis phage Mwe-JY25]